LDEYYYYATAILIISVFSITTTIIETRSVSLLRGIALEMLILDPDHGKIARDFPL
jgi:hypothetical protein